MHKKIIIVALMLLGLLGSLGLMSGCNTWEGVGKDVEETGEAMQGE